MIDNTKQIDSTASAIAMAIVKALKLPDNLTKLTLTFTPNGPPVVEFEFFIKNCPSELEDIVAGLAVYELSPVEPLALAAGGI